MTDSFSGTPSLFALSYTPHLPLRAKGFTSSEDGLVSDCGDKFMYWGEYVLRSDFPLNTFQAKGDRTLSGV
jgi:hypothetical protein